MFRSHDDLIRIDVCRNINSVIFPPVDCSILNIPDDANDAKNLFSSLWNAPAVHHLSLLFCRHKKKNRLKAMSNFANTPFSYLDSVHIWYEKASSCSNNGFLPLSEQGVLLHKGTIPNIKNTDWFASDLSNATTLWNVSVQEKEPRQFTYHQKFSWEIVLLLLSMCKPWTYQRFIYGFSGDRDSIFEFCRTFNIGVQLYESTAQEANELIKQYEEKYGKV